MTNNVSPRHCCKNFKNSNSVLLTTIHKVAGKKGSDNWQESAVCHLLYVITSLINLRHYYIHIPSETVLCVWKKHKIH